MRHLLETRILSSAVVAALFSALASYPRFSLWTNRQIPIWYLEASIFICSIILWAFVFAWHRPYTQRPVFLVRWDVKVFSLVTLIGAIYATVGYLWLDPILKTRMPEEFPADGLHWLASTLFLLGFSQLFLTFAPCDWLMRLCHREKITMILTALLSVGVVAMKLHSKDATIPPELLAVVLSAKFVSGLLTVIFYLRGGMLLAWWWAFVLETRHLVDLF